MLGAIELHLRGRRQAAFLLGALAGLARPEVWPLVGAYATYVSLSERRWWPLALGVPGMFALWIVPDWLGSGDLLHTFHLARISAEPRTLQGTGDPALELLRGAGTIAPAPVWIGALCGLAFGWRTRDRTVAALAFVAAAWAAAHRRRHRPRLSGGAPLPRRARGHLLRPRRDRRSSPSCAWRRAPAAALCWRRPWSP